MQLYIQVFSSVFLIIYILIAFIWPGVRNFRNTGIPPVSFGNTESAHDLTGRLFKVVVLITPVSVIFFCAGKNLYAFLLPASYLEIIPVQVTGMVICLLSLVWTVIAQTQMRDSWRIGIDTKNKTALIQTGLFRYSRNPVFLGMLCTVIGFFMVLPNALTLAIVVAAYLLIQVQIRLEEEFLHARHGNRYAIYVSKVKRLL